MGADKFEPGTNKSASTVLMNFLMSYGQRGKWAMGDTANKSNTLQWNIN